jgi:mono/diheme cytochrome c family protein
VTFIRPVTPLLCAFVLGLAACGGEGDDPDAAPPAGTTAATTTGGGGGDGGDVEEGNPQAGEIVFVNEGCGGCHTLADAGVVGNIDDEGSIGPDLDEAMATYEDIVEVVTNGRGAMPAFQGDISPQDIQDVAAYVSSVAGK